MLEQAGVFNDLSPALRKKLQDRVQGFGDQVQYKFDISHPNPDPSFYNGDIVWPRSYALSPKTFSVRDDSEKREGKSMSKKIGLVDKTDDKGSPASFHSVRVTEGMRGILTLDLTKVEDFNKAMFIELHPENTDGLFPDKNGSKKITRIDVVADAKKKTESRNEKKKAYKLIEAMTDKDVKQFAAAMMWDDTVAIEVIKEMVEEYAESLPEEFNKLAENTNRLKYQALAKKALDRGDWVFDPLEYKFIWRSGEPAVMLTERADRNYIEAVAEWLLTGDQRSVDAAKKLEGLTK